MALRGPQQDATRPHSRANGNRKKGSTAFTNSQRRELLPGEPKPPSWLDEDELKIWGETVPELFKAGLTHAIDAQMLAAYCSDMHEFISARKAQKLLKTEAKEAERTSLQKRADAAFARAKVVADGFGMSHKARVAQGINMAKVATAEGTPDTNASKKANWIKTAAKRKQVGS